MAQNTTKACSNMNFVFKYFCCILIYIELNRIPSDTKYLLEQFIDKNTTKINSSKNFVCINNKRV